MLLRKVTLVDNDGPHHATRRQLSVRQFGLPTNSQAELGSLATTSRKFTNAAHFGRITASSRVHVVCVAHTMVLPLFPHTRRSLGNQELRDREDHFRQLAGAASQPGGRHHRHSEAQSLVKPSADDAELAVRMTHATGRDSMRIFSFTPIW